MKPIQTRDATTSFKKPLGWDDEKDDPCGVLSVRDEKIGDRVYHYSTWKPSYTELRLLDAGGVVVLCCVGIQPPVSVSVERADDQHNQTEENPRGEIPKTLGG